jgi:hypothetical protein
MGSVPLRSVAKLEKDFGLHSHLIYRVYGGCADFCDVFSKEFLRVYAS